MSLRLVQTDDYNAHIASFQVLARRLRDCRQPITPDIREALAGIVENLQTIYENQRAIDATLSGLAFGRAVKAEQALSGTPLVLMSSEDTDRDEAEAAFGPKKPQQS